MSAEDKEEYMRLVVTLRNTHNVHDVDALLDRLDDLWFRITDEERAAVEAKMSKENERK